MVSKMSLLSSGDSELCEAVLANFLIDKRSIKFYSFYYITNLLSFR